MARTETGRYNFVVQEFGDGTPWITLQSAGDSELSILEDAILAIHLKPETGREEAEKIASSLNESVERLTFTDLKDLPHAPSA